jgi:probable O-glycosylation ligase (exosortase A-associated)
MRGLLYMCLFLSMVVPAVRAAHIAMMLWVWATLSAPGSYVWGFGASVEYSKISAIVVFISLFVDKTKKWMYANTYIILLTLLGLQMLISFTFGLNVTDRTYFIADRVWKLFLLCYLMTFIIHSRFQIHSMVLAVCLGGAIHGALEAIKYIVTGGGHVMIPPRTILDNNYFGVVMLMILPMLYYLYKYSAEPIIRLALRGGMFLTLVGVIATTSRGAVIGLAAIALATAMRSKHKVRTVALILVLGAVLGGLAGQKFYKQVDTLQTANEDGSFLSRVRSWKMNTLVAMDRPLLGGGFVVMENPVVFQMYLPRFRDLDFIPTDPPTHPLAAHSIYFETLGSTGFTGLFLFVGILITMFQYLRFIHKNARDHPSLRWAYDLANCLRISMIAYVVAGAALSMTYYELVYVVFTLISCLHHHVKMELATLVPTPGELFLARRTQGQAAAALAGAVPGRGAPAPARSASGPMR